MVRCANVEGGPLAILRNRSLNSGAPYEPLVIYTVLVREQH